MNANDGFPPELLHQPPAVRRDYFANKIVAHPKLLQTDQALTEAIEMRTGASLIVVVGPSGVGKTTLIQRVLNSLLTAVWEDLQANPDWIPYVAVEAPSTDLGFSWRDLYRRLALALNEPAPLVLAHRRLVPSSNLDADTVLLGTHMPVSRLTERRVSSADLRWAVEQCLRYRRTRAQFIDEAQHLNRVVGSQSLLRQMDNLKSLANLTGTLWVLVGTYELLNLTNLSGQLARRSLDLHFPRYLPDAGSDQQAFRNIVFTFQRHLPLAQEPDLVSHSDELYRGCLGCVGTLKDWLTRGLEQVLRSGAKTLTMTDLQRHLNADKLKQMGYEIQEGEERLARAGYLDDPLLATEIPSPPGRDQQSLGHGLAVPGPHARAIKRRVGDRKPARDPVGEAPAQSPHDQLLPGL
jgi:hypothetical protein